MEHNSIIINMYYLYYSGSANGNPDCLDRAFRAHEVMALSQWYLQICCQFTIRCIKTHILKVVADLQEEMLVSVNLVIITSSTNYETCTSFN